MPDETEAPPWGLPEEGISGRHESSDDDEEEEDEEEEESDDGEQEEGEAVRPPRRPLLLGAPELGLAPRPANVRVPQQGHLALRAAERSCASPPSSPPPRRPSRDNSV